MNKKGFTLVELIISFSLAVVICIFLLQLILSLKTLYDNSGVKTEILNKQSLISNQINKTFTSKSISSLSNCGENCIKVNYTDKTNDILKIDYNTNTLQFGNFHTTLPKNTYFKTPIIDIVYSGVVDNESNDALLYINIPIESKDLKKEEFKINVVYQFNSSNTNIEYVNFSNSGNYIVLKGDTEQVFNSKTAYVEEGYTIYDKNGNVISGTVDIDNPLTNLPYKSGNYKIKYSLKDSSGNIISQATRSITVTPSTYNITNLVTNGSFEDGNTVFTSLQNASVTTDTEKFNSGLNSILLLPVDTTLNEAYTQTEKIYSYELGHKYYYQVHYFSESTIQLFLISYNYKDNNINFSKSFKPTIQWEKASLYTGNNSSESDITVSANDIRLRIDNNNSGSYRESYFDDITLIDLTETFGAGNEPSQEWCDDNINWFEGTTTISY